MNASSRSGEAGGDVDLPQAPERPQRSQRWGDLGVRAASGLVLVAAALLSTHIGGALFVAFWGAAAVAVLWEWFRVTGAGRSKPHWNVAFGALVVVGLLSAVDVRWAAVTLVLSVFVVGLWPDRDRRAWAVGGLAYAGLFFLAVVALRFAPTDGSRAIVWLFAIVWSTDVFAYLGGRLIGGPKLWVRISPSKTWSGTLIGILAGASIGTFVAVRDLASPAATLPLLVLGTLAAALSQAGDAFESAIKRKFGVKDSSRLIPGHGGVMDRLDGFIAAVIFAFLVGLLRDPSSVARGLFSWT